jgi:hypothetical protein
MLQSVCEETLSWDMLHVVLVCFVCAFYIVACAVIAPVTYPSLCDHCCCHYVPCRPTVEPTNLLKTLAEQDTNFEAYLKLAQHQDHPNETESQVHHASTCCL